MSPLTEAQAAACPSRDPAPSAVAERREATDRVLEILDTLPANQQEVIRLKFQVAMVLLVCRYHFQQQAIVGENAHRFKGQAVNLLGLRARPHGDVDCSSVVL